MSEHAGDVAEFHPAPSIGRADRLHVGVARSAPADADVVGYAVGERGAVPRQLGLDRATLTAAGFEGKVGQTLVVPRKDGPSVAAIGVGDPAGTTAAVLRDAAAAFGRATGKLGRVATTLADTAAVAGEEAGQAVVEGLLLSRYRYGALRKEGAGNRAGRDHAASRRPGGRSPSPPARREARSSPTPPSWRRDLANTPPGHLTARRMADVAREVGASTGLQVEVFDEAALAELGCGGLLGVNAGSEEPPRMIRLTYRPRRGGTNGHLAMVGKGVMYDSGGISLKPTDPMHAAMKMDMSGAAAVLASMSTLQALGCRSNVTGYLMCTDNMPSGSAMKLGDVLRIHGGTTVEMHNTDAEGRLVLADGLVLATEQAPDAIVDIATLTGACMVALGPAMAGVFGNDQAWVDQVRDGRRRRRRAGLAAPARADEVPQAARLRHRRPEERRRPVRRGDHGGRVPVGVRRRRAWAHLDIAGPMKVDADESWRSKGATGFGTRLLIDLAVNFRPVR